MQCIIQQAVALCDRAYFDFSFSAAKTDTQFLVEEIDNTVFIAFRGTTNLRDWWSNIQLQKAIVPYENTNPKIKVHSGFIHCYYSVRDSTMQIASRAHSDVRDLVITGHSLGGAIANLAACDIQYHTGISPKLFTFGSPRIGTREWAVSVAARVKEQQRFVNKFDLIPQTPPGFFHPCIATFGAIPNGRIELLPDREQSRPHGHIEEGRTSRLTFRQMSCLLRSHHIKTYKKLIFKISQKSEEISQT